MGVEYNKVFSAPGSEKEGIVLRDMVLVLNFDDAASRCVTRKLRFERIYCKIIPGDTALEEIMAQEPLGLIVCGGAKGERPEGLDERVLRMELPILALGDAAAALLLSLGGGVGERVYEGAVVSLHYQENPLTQGIEACERLLPIARALQLPQGVNPICRAEDTVIGFAHESRPLFGLQFQPERNDMEGAMLLRNFALSVCGCTTWWDDDAFVTRAVEEIQRVTGDGRAMCSMTGGITSGVSALLGFRALGSQLNCVFVDTGLLRDHESEDFLSFYQDQIGMRIIRVSAEERFLQSLRGVTRSEEKKRVISELMRRIIRETAEGLGKIDVVIRGTCYNDIMTGRVSMPLLADETVPEIRPIRELFKDEIRRVGDYLGIPQEIVSRQPFPGSGLALRILGEVTPARLRILRAADNIFRDEVKRSSAGKKLWQYFAVLSPIPESGEDAYVICLRAVNATERSLAYAARLPYEVTENTVERIMHLLPQVKRVIYDLTPSSNYAGIEWQ